MSREAYNTIGQELTERHETTLGQPFGKLCLKLNGKAFAYFQDEMVFKLGQAEVSLLKEKYIGSVNWDPSGKNRSMKDWIQIPSEFDEDWDALAMNAMEYVESIN
jgi:hypothetical protein